MSMNIVIVALLVLPQTLLLIRNLGQAVNSFSTRFHILEIHPCNNEVRFFSHDIKVCVIVFIKRLISSVKQQYNYLIFHTVQFAVPDIRKVEIKEKSEALDVVECDYSSHNTASVVGNILLLNPNKRRILLVAGVNYFFLSVDLLL